jgi:hypothetical protein
MTGGEGVDVRAIARRLLTAAVANGVPSNSRVQLESRPPGFYAI